MTSDKAIWSIGMNSHVQLLCCTSCNVIYLISCKLCKEQFVGSAFEDNFNPRFSAHKSGVIPGKDRCGVVKHFLSKYTNGNNVENIEGNWLNKCKRLITALFVVV